MIIKLFEEYSAFGEISETKRLILKRAVDTYNIEVIDFFVKRGYDINSYDAVYNSTYDEKTFEYFLKNGANIEKHIEDYKFQKRLKELSVQKILIDNGYEIFIYNNIGFNSKLKNDPKYSDIIDRVDDMTKYNF